MVGQWWVSGRVVAGKWWDSGGVVVGHWWDSGGGSGRTVVGQ